MSDDTMPNVEEFNGTHTRLHSFDINGYRLKSDHYQYLIIRAVPWLAQGGCVTVKGMTSRSGSRKYNQQLSEQREQAVISKLRELVSTPNIFQVHGLGEGQAERDGYKDGLEDKHYRAVDLVFHLDRRPTPPPKKPVPKPPPKNRRKNVCPRLTAKVWDFWWFKKINGRFYFQNPGFCTRFTAWNFSATTLGVPVPFKGKPPVWPDQLDASGTTFWYDPNCFDPLSIWRDKTIMLRFTLNAISLWIPNAIPSQMTKTYQPLGGRGVRVLGTSVTIPMTIRGVELGAVKGIGSIKNPCMPIRIDCA